MKEYKVVGWVSYDSNYPTVETNAENLRSILFAVRKEIIDNKYYFSGAEHQNADTGVPVFDDGTCFRASMRCWGQIMASIYTGPDGKQLSYMDFYMFMDEESVLPEYKEVEVLPNQEADNFSGIVVPEDQEVVYGSISAGMPFITTDKAVQDLYDYYMERLKEEQE